MSTTDHRLALIIGDGEYGFDIVGESRYQDRLQAIAGPRTEEGCDHACTAVLLPEPDNPYDPNAVSVAIDGHVVGYLARSATVVFITALAGASYTAAACRARIRGGWDRGPDDRGYYGVKLDAILPFNLIQADAADTPTATPGRTSWLKRLFRASGN